MREHAISISGEWRQLLIDGRKREEDWGGEDEINGSVIFACMEGIQTLSVQFSMQDCEVKFGCRE